MAAIADSPRLVWPAFVDQIRARDRIVEAGGGSAVAAEFGAAWIARPPATRSALDSLSGWQVPAPAHRELCAHPPVIAMPPGCLRCRGGLFARAAAFRIVPGELC